MTFNVAAMDSPETLAGRIAIEKGIEWAIEVLNNYEDYYSLQALSIVFLTWMGKK